MVTNTNYPLPAGHTLTVSVVDGNAHVEMVGNPSVAALVTNAGASVFGPYMVPHTFRVQQSGNASVAVAEADPTAELNAAAAVIEAVPIEDAEDGETVWNDAGVLKVSSAP